MNDLLLDMRGIAFRHEGSSWTLAIRQLWFASRGMTGIVGPNGSGKSTLLRLAAGLLRPRAGCVSFEGSPIAAMSRRRIASSMGFLPQDTPPMFDFTVEEICRMGRYPHLRGIGVFTAKDRSAVERALEETDMAALRRRPLSRLSGGERRRAMIASVLAQEPRLMLLDEPTGALDIHHAAAVMRLLAGFGDIAVVVVTHDINLASLFCERMLLLRDGGVMADGPPDAVVVPALLHTAYGENLRVQKHPDTGRPIVLPTVCENKVP